MQTVTTFNMTTICMCRRHDDFCSAAPIVEIAMQLHVSSASEKVGDYPPVVKVGDLSPFPPAPTQCTCVQFIPKCSKCLSPAYTSTRDRCVLRKNFPRLIQCELLMQKLFSAFIKASCIALQTRYLQTVFEPNLTEFDGNLYASNY